MSRAGVLELEILAAVAVGQGYMAYPVRLELSLDRGRDGVTADPARFDPQWLRYAATALEAALQLGGGPQPAPGLSVAVAPPRGRAGAVPAQLTGGSASLPLALGVLCLLGGAPWPEHLYASGVLAGPDGRLLEANPAALAAKAAALDHLARIGGFRFRLLHGPSSLGAPPGAHGETMAVAGLAQAARGAGLASLGFIVP